MLALSIRQRYNNGIKGGNTKKERVMKNKKIVVTYIDSAHTVAV